jgi:hypothetical protein
MAEGCDPVASRVHRATVGVLVERIPLPTLSDAERATSEADQRHGLALGSEPDARPGPSECRDCGLDTARRRCHDSCAAADRRRRDPGESARAARRRVRSGGVEHQLVVVPRIGALARVRHPWDGVTDGPNVARRADRERDRPILVGENADRSGTHRTDHVDHCLALNKRSDLNCRYLQRKNQCRVPPDGDDAPEKDLLVLMENLC